MENQQNMLVGVLSLNGAPAEIRSKVLPKYLISNPQVTALLDMQNTKHWISDRKALEAAKLTIAQKDTEIAELGEQRDAEITKLIEQKEAEFAELIAEKEAEISRLKARNDDTKAHPKEGEAASEVRGEGDADATVRSATEPKETQKDAPDEKVTDIGSDVVVRAVDTTRLRPIVEEHRAVVADLIATRKVIAKAKEADKKFIVEKLTTEKADLLRLNDEALASDFKKIFEEA